MGRILIVDDEPAVLGIIAGILTDEGFPVQTAPDGLIARDTIANEPPDLLITDVMMPRLDAWALVAAVREHVPTLPVIILSAGDRREAARRDIFTADHTIFLRKPFDIETLLAIVERLTSTQLT